MSTKGCNHCKMDTAIRNPSGYCDHLYYPENCQTCEDAEYIGTHADNFVNSNEKD